MSVLGLILFSYQCLRSAVVRFPFYRGFKIFFFNLKRPRYIYHVAACFHVVSPLKIPEQQQNKIGCLIALANLLDLGHGKKVAEVKQKKSMNLLFCDKYIIGIARSVGHYYLLYSITVKQGYIN